MAKEELTVLIKSKELAEHTLRITSNTNRFPQKWRYSIVTRMQNTALDIYELVDSANNIDLKNDKNTRLEMQTKAIQMCTRMNTYIEMSMKLGIINRKSMEYWSKMVTDIKYMVIAWRTKDKQR